MGCDVCCHIVSMTDMLVTHRHTRTRSDGKEKKKSHLYKLHTNGTWGHGAHKNKHMLWDTHTLFMWCVCNHTHTHTCTHIDQSCSPSLWQRLGLPDLHSSRYIYRQRGDEITPSASLCSISSVLSSACSLPLGQTQTHTHRHRSGWRNDYDFLASLSCRQEWPYWRQAKCVWWISE